MSINNNIEMIIITDGKITSDIIKDNNTLMLQTYPDWEWYIECNMTWFLFYKDNKIIGNFSITETSDFGYLFYNLENVCVDINHRRQHIGSYMITELKIWCIDNNIDSISLDTNIYNIPAINLYKKNGFKIEEEISDTIYMILNLNADNDESDSDFLCSIC